MSWTREGGLLRQELRAFVLDSVARLFVWTTTANSSALGKEDAVSTGDDDPNKGQRPVRRLEPFGVRSRPPAKQRSLSLRLGSSTVIYLGVASDGGYGPGDLEDGELAIFSKNVPKALHAKDSGDVALASKDGQVVSVNGTDYALPKWDDYIAAENTFVDTVAAITPIPVVGLPGAIAAITVIVNAAVAFKNARVAAASYKSTKAKNG